MIRNSRMLGAHPSQMLFALAPNEIHTQDLNWSGRSRNFACFVYEQGHAGSFQCSSHGFRRFVIVIAETCKATTWQRSQGSQRSAQELRIALRLHGQEVAREQNQIWFSCYGALTDAPQARHRHEGPEVWIG